MTKITYQKLSYELENLKTVERAKVAKEIEEARDLGDLKENAEYHAAKDKQGLMEARIVELQDLTSRAMVIDPSTLAHERVSFGSTVELVDTQSNEEVSYTIVGANESNPNKGKVAGDNVTIILPSSKKNFDIEEVYYKEIVLHA